MLTKITLHELKSIIMTYNQIYEKELFFHVQRSRATVELIRIISDLWYDDTVELLLFRNRLIDKNVSEILNLIQYACEFIEKPISIFDVVEIARVIKNKYYPPSKIDIGKLVYEYHIDKNKGTIKDFVVDQLKNSLNSNSPEPKDVVLYGFGRIGRLLARELMINIGKGNLMRLRAIVTRGEINETILEKRAALLRNDSIHGGFHGSVSVDLDKNALIINGTTVHVISSNHPEKINYETYGIFNALIIDNTGAFRDKESLSRHLEAEGASQVLLTAPGKGVPNIVYGVNHKDYCSEEISIFSAASCTTNAIVPILKVMEDNFGVVGGHLETIHAYTNDQNLVDNFHKKYRRGRAAALNMVITETGAGKAVAKVIPSFEGKLTSNAIRVPVPNGSLAILNLRLVNAASKETINAVMKTFSLEGDFAEQIEYSISNELVSSDIVGSSAPAIFDSNATISCRKGTNVTLYVWYDNEFGYSQQVIKLARYISKVSPISYC